MGCGVSATDWRFVRAPGGGLAGSLQGPSAAAAVLSPIPAETGQRYSKRSRLTVLLWPQVQNYSLTKLRLILVGVMASAIQQFLGSSGWGIADWKVNAPPWPSVALRRSPMAKWAEAARTGRRRGR